MPCQVLLCSRMNQLFMNTYLLFYGFFPHTGHYGARRSVPCAIWGVRLSCVFCVEWCVHVSPKLPAYPSPTPRSGNHWLASYLSDSSSVLWVSSFAPFFFFLYSTYKRCQIVIAFELLHSVWQSLDSTTWLQVAWLHAFYSWATSAAHAHHLLPPVPSADGHLGCCHVLALANCVAVVTGVHASFQSMVFSRYMSKTGTAGLYGSSSFSFLRNPTLFSVMIVPIYIPTNSFF